MTKKEKAVATIGGRSPTRRAQAIGLASAPGRSLEDDIEIEKHMDLRPMERDGPSWDSAKPERAYRRAGQLK